MADKSSTVKINIIGDASKLQKAFGDAEQASGGFGSKIGGLVAKVGTGLATFGLAADGLSKIKGAATDFIGAAANYNSILSQTDTVLKSTGGAVGYTRDQLEKMAGAWADQTKFSDETVLSTQNLLLTFTNIGHDVFPDVTEAALNMSQALGTDTKSSATMLGKALQDPIKGISALSRVGVNFTDQQKDQIKAMVDAGNTMGAQKLILGELNKEYGGSAVAAGKTYEGQLERLGNAFGRIKVEIGQALIPILARLVDFIMPVATWFGTNLPPAIDAVTSAFGKLIHGDITGFLGQILEYVGRLVGIDLSGFTGSFSDMGSVLGPVLSQIGTRILNAVSDWGQAFVDWIGPKIGPMLSALGNLWVSIETWLLGTALPKLISTLGSWAGAFLDWIGPMIPPALQALGGFLQQVVSWIFNTALPMLVSNLAKWGESLVSWIAPRIGPMLSALGGLLSQLGSWALNTALPAIISYVEKWGGKLVDWIGPRIQPMLSELGKLLTQLGSWALNTALPAIISHVEKWGAEFVAWVAPKIPPLLLELGKLLVKLGDWVLTTALPEIITKLGKWGAEFVAWVAPQIPPLLLELGKLLVKLGDWIIDTALPEVLAKAGELGKALINGLIDGAKSLGGKLASFAGGLLRDTIGALVNGVIDAINWVGGKLKIGDIIDGHWNAPDIPAFAKGGITPGGPVIVGENGAELLVPPAGSGVFNKDQIVTMFKLLNGREPEGNPVGWGRGGLFDSVKHLATDAISSVASFIANEPIKILTDALTSFHIAVPGEGIAKQIGEGVLTKLKDLAVQKIKELVSGVKQALPSLGGGGGDPGNFPAGNTVLDMARQVSGVYLWCEKFVGDVMQRLGMRYARMPNAKSHAFMQPLNPGYGPPGSIEFWTNGADGHVAFNAPGGIWGTVPEGTGFRPYSWFSPPAGWTTNPYANGGVLREPVVGIGQRSGERYLFGEAGAEEITPLRSRGRRRTATGPATDIAMTVQVDEDVLMRVVAKGLVGKVNLNARGR